MGSSSSREEYVPPPPPPPRPPLLPPLLPPPPRPPLPPPQRPQPLCFSEPWRSIPMSYQENLDFLKSYKPQNREVPHLRILLHGPVEAGKSSFVNSVDSALRGQVTTRALTDTTGGHSFTLTYKTYKIYKDSQSFYSFVFNDIMGFEQNFDKGVQVEDVRLALQGHVRDGYRFNPERPITTNDPRYNPNPSLEDKVQVLVCVIPADKVSLLTGKVVQKLKEVRKTASDLGIPQVAILTKVDQACPEVKKDTSNIYKSKYLKEQLEKFSNELGIQPNCIFLVKNYNTEGRTDDNVDALILAALRQMLTLGEDFLNNQ